MNQKPLSPDDPRLTAYALDEMAPAERAEFEPLLRQDAAAQKAVAEIRAAGALLTAALEHEPVGAEPVHPAILQAAIIAGHDPRKLDGGPLKAPGRLLRFPQLYYTLSGLAAACFAVFFVYWQRTHWVEPKQYIEVSLAPASADREARQAEEAKKADVDERKRRDAEAMAAKSEARLQAEPAPSPAAAARPVTPDAAREELVALDKSQMVADGRNAPSANAVSYAARQTPQAVHPAETGGAAVAGRAQSARVGGGTETGGSRKDSDGLRGADQAASDLLTGAGTASYATLRRFLQQGKRPPADAVRIEELVNHFPYHYAPPAGNAPFAVALESAGAPWNPTHRLVRIGLKGRAAADSPAGGMPPTIAKEVKIRVEFNPQTVQSYRLIGYDDRRPVGEEQDNDQVDAGDIGAGQAVTALYEVVPAGTEPAGLPGVDPAQYRKPGTTYRVAVDLGELLIVKVAYQDPVGGGSGRLEFPLRDGAATFARASPDFKFAAAVAAFGMVLRDSPHKGASTLANVAAWGREGLGDDAGGYRAEFLSLVQQVQALP